MRTFGSARPRCRPQRGMTLVETMVAMSVFSLVVIGLVYTQMFCLRYDQLCNSKLGASDNARHGFDQLSSDIRSAKEWYIGSGSATSFAPCGNATNQIGNALQICYTVNTNAYIRYYFDTSHACLYRLDNNVGTPVKMASSLTNASGLGMTFEAQRYDGTTLQDVQFKYVIVTTLEFCQYQYPLTKVGPGYFYDYYRIQFKITSHNFN
ncbi:MAG: PilW family protein [Limisphaerales bacterium]